MVHEALRREHRNLAGCDVFRRGDAVRAAEMIGVRMGVDETDNRLVTALWA
jgi:hypothetical protein